MTNNSGIRYKLTYYNARGSVEPIRLIFAYKGVEYEDVRIPIGSLTPQKKKELGITLGSLPLLEVDGQVYSQYLAITRYVATQFGLAEGETELETLRMEETVFMMDEYFKKWVSVFFCKCGELRQEMSENIMAIENVRIMTYYDRIYRENQELGNNWLVGKKLSWADIFFAYYTSRGNDLVINVADFLDDYPSLQELRERVLNQPGIKEYIATRPVTDF